jgi:hypothetical protein
VQSEAHLPFMVCNSSRPILAGVNARDRATNAALLSAFGMTDAAAPGFSNPRWLGLLSDAAAAAPLQRSSRRPVLDPATCDGSVRGATADPGRSCAAASVMAERPLTRRTAALRLGRSATRGGRQRWIRTPQTLRLQCASGCQAAAGNPALVELPVALGSGVSTQGAAAGLAPLTTPGRAFALRVSNCRNHRTLLLVAAGDDGGACSPGAQRGCPRRGTELTRERWSRRSRRARGRHVLRSVQAFAPLGAGAMELRFATR